MREKNLKNLIIKELVFIFVEWLIFFITYIVFNYISLITGQNTGFLLVGYIIWIIGLIVIGIKFSKNNDKICTEYNMTRLKLGLITFLTLIITNTTFSIVIFQLGYYGKIPFEIYSEFDFLIYILMAISFIIITIFVLGIGYLVKAIKTKKM